MLFGKEKTSFIFVALIVLSSNLISVYGEVDLVQTDKNSYSKGDKINFSGMVEDDSSGLVTIVIRDSNDEFVLLTQSMINQDSSFANSVHTNEKFITQGKYNVTAFILNLTAGASTSFDFSFTEDSIVNKDESITNPEKDNNLTNLDNNQTEQKPITDEKTREGSVELFSSYRDPKKDPQHYIDRYNNEPAYKAWFDTNFPNISIEEALEINQERPESIEVVNSKIAPFVDPKKDPQHYIDRYNNEPAYKAWFDRSYPSMTIEDAVGAEDFQETPPEFEENSAVSKIINQDIIPEAEASTNIAESINNDSNNSEMATMILALGGIGILFGAVYGVKRKVDNNSFQISQNRATIKKKLLSGFLSSDPADVIKERLARGEITIDEYSKLKRTLNKK